MATQAKILCKNCENTFLIFWDTFKEYEKIICPYCKCFLDTKFNNLLKKALGSIWELNKEIVGSNQENNTDLFEISAEYVSIPTDKFKLLQEK